MSTGSGAGHDKSKGSKETIRLKKRDVDASLLKEQPDSQGRVSSPPGLSRGPATSKPVCFCEGSTLVCPCKARCQYCHAWCSRSDADHLSHRCAQHVNW